MFGLGFQEGLAAIGRLGLPHGVDNANPVVGERANGNAVALSLRTLFDMIRIEPISRVNSRYSIIMA